MGGFRSQLRLARAVVPRGLLAQTIGRKGAKELETRSRREETLRTLRWAAELSASKDDRLADLGVAELDALIRSELLEDTEKAFVEAALAVVYEDAESKLNQFGGEAVERVSDDQSLSGAPSSKISSYPDENGDLNDD